MAHLAHYRESHPLPFIITHWINLVGFVLLIFTGFYIHYPFFPDFMSQARGVHIFFGFVIVLNCIFRVIAAFFIKSAPAEGTREVETDIHSWLPQKGNRHQLGAWIKYYLFIKKTHPLGAKFGVPQKISYSLIPFLILFMGYTGVCLWAPAQQVGFFAAGINLFGGLAGIRILHYVFMWVFIIFIFIHVYLANIEGLSPTFMMFFWKEHPGLTYDPKTGMITGYDDLGEGDAATETVPATK
jgi:Ni/Fe-hydrogenase 1 B-type cytochrome subunit